MKKCENCKNVNKKKDKYCRACGIKMHHSSYYILINITNILLILALIFMSLLFIASYLVN